MFTAKSHGDFIASCWRNKHHVWRIEEIFYTKSKLALYKIYLEKIIVLN